MKFVKFCLFAILGWLAVFGGDVSNSPFDYVYHFSNHPRLVGALCGIVGLLEVGLVIGGVFLFGWLLHNLWFGILCSLGAYIAFLAIGTLIELCVRFAQKRSAEK